MNFINRQPDIHNPCSCLMRSNFKLHIVYSFYYFSHHNILKIIKSIGSIYVQKKINFDKNISNYGRFIPMNQKKNPADKGE